MIAWKAADVNKRHWEFDEYFGQQLKKGRQNKPNLQAEYSNGLRVSSFVWFPVGHCDTVNMFMLTYAKLC